MNLLDAVPFLCNVSPSPATPIGDREMNWTKTEDRGWTATGYPHNGSATPYEITFQSGRYKLYAGGAKIAGPGSKTKMMDEAEAMERRLAAQTGPPPDAEPVPAAQPADAPADPDLSPDTVAEPMTVGEPAPTAPGPVPAPLTAPEPAPVEPDHTAGAADRDSVDATLAQIDRDSLTNTFNRLVLYRDLTWVGGGRLRSVRRYGDISAE